MIHLLMLQKSAPDLTNVLLIFIAVFAFLLAMSSLYNWIKSKPWHKKDSVESDSKAATRKNSISESEQQDISNKRTSEAYS
jgi:hypothetical protein